MKNLFLRTGAALACALALASCGGSGGNLALGGYVTGVTVDGLVLQNNGGSDLVVPANSTTFVFTQLVAYDTAFNVTVKSSPPNAVCTPTSNTGTTGTYDINTIIITCVINQYNLSATVTGLVGTGLVLNNGADRVAVDAGAKTATFAKVNDGAAYGVTVLTQPAGQTCTVTNGSGKIAAAAVSNVQVSCT